MSEVVRENPCTECGIKGLYEHCEDKCVQYRKWYQYQQGRVDELDKISKMILLGCDELKCDDCGYKEYSQDVCQQAFTIGMIENYIAEQLKEQTDE